MAVLASTLSAHMLSQAMPLPDDVLAAPCTTHHVCVVCAQQVVMLP